MDRLGSTISGVCAGETAGTVSHGAAASGRRCGNVVSAEMGLSKTNGLRRGKKRLPSKKREGCSTDLRSQAPKQLIPRAFQRGPQSHQDRQGRKIAAGLYALVIPAADSDLLCDFLLGTPSPGAQPCNVLAKLRKLGVGGFGGHNRPRESRRMRSSNTMLYIVSWLGPCFLGTLSRKCPIPCASHPQNEGTRGG